MKAMILAAGRGKRMREMTDDTPKPLIEVQNRSILDRLLDRLAKEGIRETVVNLHYQGDKIKRHLKARTDFSFVFSEEKEALETGGGVKKALPHLGTDPFLVLNGDPVWTEKPDGGAGVIRDMIRMFNPETTDILLFVVPIARVFGHDGAGDYFLEDDGATLCRQKTPKAPAPYVYGGVQILKPELFKAVPDDYFSLRVLYDAAEAKGRLKGYVHGGNWYHIGTPEAYRITQEAALDS